MILYPFSGGIIQALLKLFKKGIKIESLAKEIVSIYYSIHQYEEKKFKEISSSFVELFILRCILEINLKYKILKENYSQMRISKELPEILEFFQDRFNKNCNWENKEQIKQDKINEQRDQVIIIIN